MLRVRTSLRVRVLRTLKRKKKRTATIVRTRFLRCHLCTRITLPSLFTYTFTLYANSVSAAFIFTGRFLRTVLAFVLRIAKTFAVFANSLSRAIGWALGYDITCITLVSRIATARFLPTDSISVALALIITRRFRKTHGESLWRGRLFSWVCVCVRK